VEHNENVLEELYLRTFCYRSLNLSTKKLSKMLYSGDHTFDKIAIDI